MPNDIQKINNTKDNNYNKTMLIKLFFVRLIKNYVHQIFYGTQKSTRTAAVRSSSEGISSLHN